MSYGESGSAWGIHTCSGSWSYAGASSCSPCPVDPLDGVHGFGMILTPVRLVVGSRPLRHQGLILD